MVNLLNKYLYGLVALDCGGEDRANLYFHASSAAQFWDY